MTQISTAWYNDGYTLTSLSGGHLIPCNCQVCQPCTLHWKISGKYLGLFVAEKLSRKPAWTNNVRFWKISRLFAAEKLYRKPACTNNARSLDGAASMNRNLAMRNLYMVPNTGDRHGCHPRCMDAVASSAQPHTACFASTQPHSSHTPISYPLPTRQASYIIITGQTSSVTRVERPQFVL